MYCKYCGKQIDDHASFCINCGKRSNEITTITKSSIAMILTVVMILFSFYGIFADAITITDEGELNPLGFSILILLAGCAILLYKTRVYLFNIFCYGALSIIYLIRIINLKEVLTEKYGEYIDFDSFKFLYWTFFITLSVLTTALAIKYNREIRSENLFQKLSGFKDRQKNPKAITSDEMNSIVLSGMSNKSILLLIGLISCSIEVILTYISDKDQINIYLILLLLSNVCIGFFLYAIHKNIGLKQPLIKLNQSFVIALFAFLIKLGLEMRVMIIWHFYEYFMVLCIIKIIVDIVLCFCFFKLFRAFKGKQNTAHLELWLVVSIVCLCMTLVLDLLSKFLFYYYKNFDSYYFYFSKFRAFRSCFGDYWEEILQLSLNYKVMMIAPIILTIVLILLLRNIQRGLKSFTTNIKVNEENKYCDTQIDDQANVSSNYGKGVNEFININKRSFAIVISVVLILLCIYGIYADAVTITDEGELKPLGFCMLILLAGCAIVLFKTRVYLVNTICFGLLSIIYLFKIINLHELEDKYWDIDLESFQILYWAYFIVLSVFSIILVLKYLYESENEIILNWLKKIKHLSIDDMNKVVLTGLNKKRYHFLFLIGIGCCLISIVSNIFLLRPYRTTRMFQLDNYFRPRSLYLSWIGDYYMNSYIEYFILSILYFICIGIFLYALHSNLKNRKPIVQLSRCINIALCAFLIQLFSSISFTIYKDNNDEIKVISIIAIAVNIGLCLSFYILCSGFKSRLGSIQLKICIIFSMLCLGMSLAISAYNLYNVHEELDISSYYSLYDKIGVLKDSMEIIVIIILLFVINNMRRNLKALDVSVEETEENTLTM